MKIEDMRDFIRDYWIDNANDISDNGDGIEFEAVMGQEHIVGSMDDIVDYIDDMTDAEVATEYYRLSH